jgi:hypothetical protein
MPTAAVSKASPGDHLAGVPQSSAIDRNSCQAFFPISFSAANDLWRLNGWLLMKNLDRVLLVPTDVHLFRLSLIAPIPSCCWSEGKKYWADEQAVSSSLAARSIHCARRVIDLALLACFLCIESGRFVSVADS